MATNRGVRRIGIVLGGTAFLVIGATLVGPFDGGVMGVTFCYPLVGPVQRFGPDMADSMLLRVRAHEQVHADQCRRNGAVRHLFGRMLTGHRLRSEAEAGCAEIRQGIADGRQARLVYASTLDELRETPWFRRVKTAAMVDALASQCPAIARRAAREEAEWQARVRLHRSP